MARNSQEVLTDLLVLRCQDGDAAALEMLARHWHPKVFRHAFRLTRQRDAAEEIAQEAWLAMVRGLRRLHDPAVFRGWAYRIVSNKSSDWIRRQQARRRLNDRVEREPPVTQGDNERETAIWRLQRAVEALPEPRRLILSMYYLEGMGVREIAEALSIPAGTVKSRLFHARQQLKRCLGEAHEEDG